MLFLDQLSTISWLRKITLPFFLSFYKMLFSQYLKYIFFISHVTWQKKKVKNKKRNNCVRRGDKGLIYLPQQIILE